MHSNVMLRFMVQAFQDPPLCSSTVQLDDVIEEVEGVQRTNGLIDFVARRSCPFVEIGSNSPNPVRYTARIATFIFSFSLNLSSLSVAGIGLLIWLKGE
jgi:hypothetical protein